MSKGERGWGADGRTPAHPPSARRGSLLSGWWWGTCSSLRTPCFPSGGSSSSPLPLSPLRPAVTPRPRTERCSAAAGATRCCRPLCSFAVRCFVGCGRAVGGHILPDSVGCGRGGGCSCSVVPARAPRPRFARCALAGFPLFPRTQSPPAHGLQPCVDALLVGVLPCPLPRTSLPLSPIPWHDGRPSAHDHRRESGGGSSAYGHHRCLCGVRARSARPDRHRVGPGAVHPRPVVWLQRSLCRGADGGKLPPSRQPGRCARGAAVYHHYPQRRRQRSGYRTAAARPLVFGCQLGGMVVAGRGWGEAARVCRA